MQKAFAQVPFEREEPLRESVPAHVGNPFAQERRQLSEKAQVFFPERVERSAQVQGEERLREKPQAAQAAQREPPLPEPRAYAVSLASVRRAGLGTHPPEDGGHPAC